jgi:hypothetical protein
VGPPSSKNHSSRWTTSSGEDQQDADPQSDVLHFHLEARGFVDPDTTHLEPMVRALESANSLPFGTVGHVWVSLLPDSSLPHRVELVSDNSLPWSKVVDRLITAPTQFEKDVFWRVRRICRASQSDPLPLEDRKTNVPVHTSRWHRDYRLFEAERYEIFVQTYSPGGHGQTVPGNATIAMTSRDDEQGLIKLAANPLAIVPNEISSQRFSIDTDAALQSRYAGVRLETQIPGRDSPFAAGSLCTLTFAIRKRLYRLVWGILLLTGAAMATGSAAGSKINAMEKGGLAVLALLLEPLARGC